MTQNYTYDLLNRLTEAQEGSAWTQNYLFDAFGNRALSLGSQHAGAANATPFAASSSAMPYDAHNHWTGAGVSTDNDGNLLTVNGQTMTYDAENRRTQVAGGNSGTVTFNYDGTGRRVTKTVAGVGTTTFVYDVKGEMVAEYGSMTSPCATCYLTADPLGSTRLVTDANIANTSICATVTNCLWRHDDLPFGEEIPYSWGSRNSIAGIVWDSGREMG